MPNNQTLPHIPVPLKFMVHSLGELSGCVKDAITILRRYAKNQNSVASIDEYKQRREYPIWYRGHADASFLLLPSLFRSETHKYDHINPYAPYTYVEAKTLERDRIQQFSARAYHRLESKPNSSIEWLEIMQHYQVNTRLMDWSENLYTAVMFALESYMSNPKDARWRVDNRQTSPSIWLLSPVKLNEVTFNTIIDDHAILEKALHHLFSPMTPKDITDISSLSREYIKFALPDFRIVSLSRLAEMRPYEAHRLPDVFFTGELNPLLYLLLRIYDDGVELPISVPPLAIMHPYHSQRIETQRGVFTIFPQSAQSPNSIISLDDFPESGSFLCEIRLANPQGIANELRSAGYDRTFLYPDLTEYGQAIEWR